MFLLLFYCERYSQNLFDLLFASGALATSPNQHGRDYAAQK